MPAQNLIHARSVHTNELKETIHAFITWLDKNGDTSQDQYDFWASSFGKRAKAAYYRNKWLGLPLVAPFILLDNLVPSTRSLVRQPHRFPIADAHLAMAFWVLSEVEQNPLCANRAHTYLEALKSSRCEDYEEYCWGYPFDWRTNTREIKSGTPLITTIPYCYEAFETGYEITGDTEYFAIMESTARFVFQHFNSTELSPGIVASSYTPSDHRQVVNASSYRGYMLASAGKRFGKPEWVEAANGNLAFVLHSQQADGSWLYATDGIDRFIDNFHTCFVLKNLYKAWLLNGNPDVFTAVKLGYQFYIQYLLDQHGLPRPFARSERPVLQNRELYDFAEGINLALLLKEIEPEAPEVLEILLHHLLNKWILPDGHFITRQSLIGHNTVPYLRWAQSQTFLSIVRCYAEQFRSSDPVGKQAL